MDYTTFVPAQLSSCCVVAAVTVVLITDFLVKPVIPLYRDLIAARAMHCIGDGAFDST
jgi:hypothetical protein